MRTNRSSNMYVIRCILFLFCCLPPALCYGLEPQEVLVVANKEMPGSVDLAQYYMEKRSIPSSHLLTLSLAVEETMTRQEYDSVLASGVRSFLDEGSGQGRIAAIVLMYGVPLKVAPPLPGAENMEKIRGYRQNREELEATVEEETSDIKMLKNELSEKIKDLLNLNQRAAVDSELSLVKQEHYDLDGWIKNPYYIGNQGSDAIIKKDQVLLVCRLDGPDSQTVYRIINDTLWAEEQGLQGRGYFDARWPMPESSESLGGYRFYDQSLHKAAEKTKKRMAVTLDASEELFSPESCPDAALYCGWYSLGKYVDSFDWVRGAIGYHIASSECTTLRKPESKVWCKRMLEEGVAATIGPVHEPYVQGFPVPEVFFSYLTEGYMSLGEAYLVSLPFISWQTVLIGDPLYQPFSPMEVSSPLENTK